MVTSLTWVYEQHYSHAQHICGIDEAGRGAWAGPVVAAAVIWPLDSRVALPSGLRDSKQLSAIQREQLYEVICSHAHIGVGSVSAHEIDATNILAATLLAMQRAYAALPHPAEVALVDGNQPASLPCQVVTLIKGDSKSPSIAAASIIAKVTRDRLMQQLHHDYPQYGFLHHVGYGTSAHRDALKIHGICPEHRRTFRPMREMRECCAEGQAVPT